MTARNQSGFSVVLICFLVLLIISILVGGYLFFNSNRVTLQKSIDTESNTSKSSAKQSSTGPKIKTNISTVTEALSASIEKSIECTRVGDNTTPPGTVYIKDGKIRFDGGNKGLMLQPKTSGLSTNEALWIWVPNASEGQKFTVSPRDPSSPKDVAKGLDEYKQDCSFVELDEKLFMAPENINFKSY